MADRAKRNDCEETTAALEAADRLVSRIQRRIADDLPPDSGVTSNELLGEIIEELERAPEIDRMREALGEDPSRFGAPGPRRR